MPFSDIFGGGIGSCPVVTLPTGDFALDVEFIAVAREIIDDFVEMPNAIWVSTPTDIAPDPLKPWEVTPGVEIEHAIRMIFLPEDRIGRETLNYIPESVMSKGHVYGITYDHGFEMTLKDTVVYGGRSLTVQSIDPIQPVDQAIIFIVVLGA